MPWEQMSIDEYAEYEMKNGTPLLKSGDIWWRAVRPFFYRPLFPFQKLNRTEIVAPKRFVFGYQHAVKEESQANSTLKLMIYPDIKNYSIDRLSRKRRYYIRKAMNLLEVQCLTDCEMFIRNAYEIYREFFDRTKYNYKKSRLKKQKFAAWSENIFNRKKIRVHGVFNRGNVMVAVHISYLIGNILFNASCFAKKIALETWATDLVDHCIREDATRQENISLIYDGPYTGKCGIDRAKLLRGDIIYNLPAYTSMGKYIVGFLKLFNNNLYAKICKNEPT